MNVSLNKRGLKMSNISEEEVKESTWNLCKVYDLKNKGRERIRLQNFITLSLELRYGPVIENLYRENWLKEVEIFCNKYHYQ
jgi:hypothetical protein